MNGLLMVEKFAQNKGQIKDDLARYRSVGG